MRAQRLLLAALVVVLVATGAVVWAATSTGDGDSPEVLSSSDPSDDVAPSSAPAITTPPQPETPQQDPQPAEPEQPAPTTTAPSPEQPAPGDDSASGGTQKTHFKREPKSRQQNDKPDRSFAVPPARQFSGNGNASLGTVDVKANSLLKWKARGRLEIRFGREAFPIVAPTNSGQLVLPPFLFTKVRVLAAGPWKITVSPQ